MELINGIASGELKPEFALPEDRYEPAQWVEADLSTLVVFKQADQSGMPHFYKVKTMIF